jgi:hypothetical protein
MSIIWEEVPDSRSSTKDPASITYKFSASGEFNDGVVRTHAYGMTPAFVDFDGQTLYRKDVKLDAVGYAQYLATVPYEKKSRTAGQVGSYTWDFDTTGATVGLKAAKQHVKSYPDDGEWHKGSIGVNGQDVQGAQIVIPALKYNFRFKHPQGVLTIDYSRTLARHTGKTNSVKFGPFDPGELLFAGANGSDGSEAEAECGYQIIASANETGSSVGEITGIAKKGHDLLWIEFEDDTSGGEATKPPKRVHIERVYDEIDFASVFGWSLP